jgi:bifunctional non-homologous end joining protein LigD
MARPPQWLEPMAAMLTQERFTGPEWIFERKLDGIRLLAFRDGRDVRLLSRNRLSQNASYESVVDAVARLPVHDVVLAPGARGPGRRREAPGSARAARAGRA